VSFSYGRALQQPSLKAWKGHASNVAAGQAALLHRSRMNSLATYGKYSDKEEKQAKAA
jgi:fructose-bisphosphate aldolase class I